nr:radical SAM protein [Mesorhizobium sp. B1-1-7]
MLGIYLTNRCNMRCAHCCVNSGPQERSRVDLATLLPQFADLANAGAIMAIHVSGGEPFLFPDDIRAIAAIGNLARIPVAVNTNGFWGRQVSKAELLLRSMPGVTQLIFSADTFHEKFLDTRHLRTGIAVALSLGIRIKVTVCTEAGLRTEYVKELENSFGTDLLSQMEFVVVPVEPGGRASALKEAYWRPDLRELPPGRCDVINRPVVMENGDVLACANTVTASRTDGNYLKIGNIREKKLSAILDDGKSSNFVRAMRVLGPKFLADQLPSQDRSKLRAFYPKDDICQLCEDLVAPSMRAGLERVLHSEQLSRAIFVAEAIAPVETFGFAGDAR